MLVTDLAFFIHTSSRYMNHCKTSTLATYLIYRQRVRVPGVDPGLIDIHHSDRDLGTHLCDHSARRTPYIAGPNATNLLYLKHLGKRWGGKRLE